MPARTASRRRRTAGEAKRLILEAAEKRLMEGGPEAIRLQDVAADVGVSHPAILHHFGSREGLMLALENRALTRLRDDLLGSADASTQEVLDQVYATLGDKGYARLLNWAVQRGLVGPEGAAAAADGSGEHMIRDLADAWHASRCEDADATGLAAPDREDTDFAVRLAATAMFGEALIGPLLTRSAGLGDDAQVRRRFRRWLGELLSD